MAGHSSIVVRRSQALRARNTGTPSWSSAQAERVAVAEAVELGAVVGVEPARRLVGGAVEAGGEVVFGGEPRRQHIELQGADDADDPVAAD